MAATRANIRDEARDRADQDESDFPTDAQYNRAIDRGATRVFMDMVAAGWPANYTTATVLANGSSAVYAFSPTNFVGSQLVYTVYGGRRIELSRVNPGDAPGLRSTPTTGPYSNYYELRLDINQGPVIELFPRLAGTYYVDYIQGFGGFTNDASVWPGPYGTDELLVLHAARFGVLKENRAGDAEVIRKEYEDRLYDFKRTASWVDMRNSALVRRTGSGADRFSDFRYDAMPDLDL